MSHWHQRFPSNNYQAVERKVTRPFINAFVGDVPPQAACVWGGTLTSTVGLWRRRAFLESCVLLGGSDGRIRLQTLGHFVADDIHKTLKRLLDINVILGTCFKKFKPWKKQTQLGHFILLLKVNETWLWFFLVIVGDLRGGPKTQFEQMLSSCYQILFTGMLTFIYAPSMAEWTTTTKSLCRSLFKNPPPCLCPPFLQLLAPRKLPGIFTETGDVAYFPYSISDLAKIVSGPILINCDYLKGLLTPPPTTLPSDSFWACPSAAPPSLEGWLLVNFQYPTGHKVALQSQWS